MHYNANFACGTCLSAVTSSCQQMKRHINECKGLDPPMPPSLQGLAGPPIALQESARSGHSPKKSSQESKHMGRKKKGHHSRKPRPAVSASQEDSQVMDRCMWPTWLVPAKRAWLNQWSATLEWKKKSKSHKKYKSSKWSNTCTSKCSSAFHSYIPLFSLNKLVSHSPVLVVVNIVIVDHVRAKLGYR